MHQLKRSFRTRLVILAALVVFVIGNVLFLSTLSPTSNDDTDEAPSAAIYKPEHVAVVRFEEFPVKKTPPINPPAQASLRNRGIVVSVVSVLVRSDEKHLTGWLENLISQTIFKNVEVLIATFEGKISEHAAQALQEYEKKYPNIRRVHFQVDGGLYTVHRVVIVCSDHFEQAWSDLIRDHSKGVYITNCNPDDRRPRDSLERQVAFLDSNPGVSLVCGAVRACYGLDDPDSIDWLTSDQCGTWNDSPTFEIRLYDLFEYDVYGRYVRGRNPPHNAPMWRRTLHQKAGYFDEKYQPYSDHLLWLRAVAAEQRAVKQGGPPHALYVVHGNSHNRRKKLEQQVAEQRVLFDMMKFQLHQGLRPLNIVVMHEQLSVFSGGDIRVLQLMRFLSSQGHRLFYIARLPYEPDGVAAIEPFVVAYSLRDQPMHAVAEWMRMGITFDVAIMGTWFYKPVSIPEVIVPRFRARSPRTVLVALTDDIHAIRRPQMGLLKCCDVCTDPPTTGADLDACNLSLEREINVYRSVDLVLTIADEDAATIRSLLHQPEPVVEVFPFVEARVTETAPSPKSRYTVLWCAAFHSANENAFQWFIREVWVHVVARVPQAKLVVIGWEWHKYANDVKMELLNRQTSLEPELARTRVLVNPVSVYGSGISTKTVLGFAHGVPTLTQPAGVRGLACKENDGSALFPHVAADDSPETFVSQLIRLFTQDAYWSEVSVLQLSFASACLTEAAQYRETGFTGMLRALASRPAPEKPSPPLLPPVFDRTAWLTFATRQPQSINKVDREDEERAQSRAACQHLERKLAYFPDDVAEQRLPTYVMSNQGSGYDWFRRLVEMASGVQSAKWSSRKSVDAGKTDAKAVVVQAPDSMHPSLELRHGFRLIVLLRHPLESLWSSYVTSHNDNSERLTVESVARAGDFQSFCIKQVRLWTRILGFAVQYADSADVLMVNYEKLVLFRKREMARVLNFLAVKENGLRMDCLDLLHHDRFVPSLLPAASAVFRAHCGLAHKLLPVIFSTDLRLLGLSFTRASLLQEYDCPESLEAFLAEENSSSDSVSQSTDLSN